MSAPNWTERNRTDRRSPEADLELVLQHKDIGATGSWHWALPALARLLLDLREEVAQLKEQVRRESPPDPAGGRFQHLEID